MTDTFNSGEVQIKTGDFEYINIKLTGGPKDFVEKFRELKQEWELSKGLPAKEFDQFIQRMMEGDDNHIDQMEQMNELQKWCMQVVKRAYNRIEYKIRKAENIDEDLPGPGKGENGDWSGQD